MGRSRTVKLKDSTIYYTYVHSTYAYACTHSHNGKYVDKLVDSQHWQMAPTAPTVH